MKKKSTKQENDELDMSRLNETVEETERRRDAEANLTDLHSLNAPGSPGFDAPFAPGLGSAGIVPNDEDGDYRDTGSMTRIDLGDGSINGMSDLNDVSSNPQVYNGPKLPDELADLSEGGIGGMTIEHINDINHGTGALPEEVREHESRRKAERVRFKTPGAKTLNDIPARNNGANARRGGTSSSGGKSNTGNGARTSAKKSSPAKTKTASKKSSPAKSSPAKAASKKSPIKSAVKKSASKKATSKQSSRSSSGKSAGKKVTSSKKTSAKKAAVKNSSSKKATAKKATAKKATSKKSAASRSNVKSGSKKKTSRR